MAHVACVVRAHRHEQLQDDHVVPLGTVTTNLLAGRHQPHRGPGVVLVQLQEVEAHVPRDITSSSPSLEHASTSSMTMSASSSRVTCGEDRIVLLGDKSRYRAESTFHLHHLISVRTDLLHSHSRGEVWSGAPARFPHLTSAELSLKLKL